MMNAGSQNIVKAPQIYFDMVIYLLAYTYYSLMPENLTGPKMTREDILRIEKRDSNL